MLHDDDIDDITRLKLELAILLKEQAADSSVSASASTSAISITKSTSSFTEI